MNGENEFDIFAALFQIVANRCLKRRKIVGIRKMLGPQHKEKAAKVVTVLSLG